MTTNGGESYIVMIFRVSRRMAMAGFGILALGLISIVSGRGMAHPVPTLQALSAKPSGPPAWLIGHSGKKGICLGGGEGGRTWGQTIKLLHACWVYNWSLRPSGPVPRGVHFIPMVWGHPGRLGGDVAWLTAQHKLHRYKYLLTFNEPDNRTQSNMTFQHALKRWPNLELTGMVLGSPACVHPDDPWMIHFMGGAALRHYKVNFVCVHWYGSPNPAKFLNLIVHTYLLYHRPIWITEFAVADWGASRQQPDPYTPLMVARFLRVVLPALNRMRFVQCYAWYPYGGVSRFTPLGCSGLFNKKGNLTLVGRVYASG